VEFGDPVAATDYRLCLYDTTGGVPVAKMTLPIPAGGTCVRRHSAAPCWTPIGRRIVTGFRYLDAALTSSGVQTIWLRSGPRGGAIFFRAKGPLLPVPTPASADHLLAEDPSVITQLSNSDGFCWEATYSTPPQVTKPSRFRDKKP